MRSILVVMAWISLSGCATILTQGFADEMDERVSETGEFGEIPRVFSGSYFDIMSQPSVSALIDLPLSLVADTLILPYTIATQIKYGNVGQHNIAAVPLGASLTEIRHATLAGRHGDHLFLLPDSYEGDRVDSREPDSKGRRLIESDLSIALGDVSEKFQRDARRRNLNINLKPLSVNLLATSELEASACHTNSNTAVTISTGTLRKSYTSVLPDGVGEKDLRKIIYLMYVDPGLLTSSIVEVFSANSLDDPPQIASAVAGHIVAQSYSSALIFVLAHEAYHVWVDKCDASLYGKDSEVMADILGVIAMKKLLPDTQPGEGKGISVRLREPLPNILQRLYGDNPLLSKGDLFHMPLSERLKILERLYGGDDAQALKQVWNEFVDRTKN